MYSPPGSTTPRFKTGDKVVGLVVFSHIVSTGRGALAREVAIPARYAAKIPEGKGEREVAGLLVAGCTAVKMVDEARVKTGHRVLVVGGSGGVGSMALQMVSDRVGREGVAVGVCSGESVAIVKGLAADEVGGCFERQRGDRLT